MARKVIQQLVDDLDGSPIADGEGETVHFALDGRSYEIDLTTSHAAQLRSAFDVYKRAARQIGGASRARSATGSGRSSAELAAIRSWARSQGITVSERGRVAADVVTAYENRAR